MSWHPIGNKPLAKPMITVDNDLLIMHTTSNHDMIPHGVMASAAVILILFSRYITISTQKEAIYDLIQIRMDIRQRHCSECYIRSRNDSYLKLYSSVYSTPLLSLNRVIIGSSNGLSPGRHQAITGTNAGLLSIGLLGTSFSEIWNFNSVLFIQENAF